MSARYDDDFAALFGDSEAGDRGDVPFFRALVAATTGPVCEVGAGTGRVILAVEEAAGRRRLTGVEPSAAMRDVFTRKVEAIGSTVAVVPGSFEQIPLRSGSQGVVFGAFRSFQHVLTTDAQLTALAECRRVLKPGGVLALDFFDPAYHLLRRARPSLGVTYRSARSTIVARWESREVDRVAQRVDVTFRWVERDLDGVVIGDVSATYGVRYTFPIELEHLLARAGFEAIDLRGGYDGRALAARPRELVVVCRAPPKRNGQKRSGSNASP